MADLGKVMAAVETGRSATAARELIEPRVKLLNKDADMRAFQAIARGELTPNMALQLFMEKYGYWRMLTTLLHQQKAGQAAGQVLADELNPNQETKDGSKYSGA